MMKKISSILLLCIFSTFAGCTKDGISDQNPSNGLVGFSTNTLSRGTPISDVSQLTTMGVFCSFTGAADWSASSAPGKMFNQKTNNNLGVWEYPAGEEVYWGATELSHRYSFFAYAPYVSPDNGLTVNGSSATPGVPTLTYTVPTDVALQPDLMVSVPYKNMRPTGSDVPLAMKHALTCVGFQIKSDTGSDEKIKGIAIKGVSITGDLSIDGSTIVWRNLGAVNTTTDFSASINFDAGQSYYTATGAMSSNLINGNGYLMMIPQALGSNASIVITKQDNTTVEIGLNTHTWLTGKTVIYNITLVPGGTVTVTPTSLILPFIGVTQSSDNIEVICKDFNGIDAPNLPWSFTSTESWLTLTLNSNGTGASQTVSGTGSRTIYTIAQAYTLNLDRSAKIHHTANTSDVVGTVLQKRAVDIHDNAFSFAQNSGKMYVGAFWRDNQKGERVIRCSFGAMPGGAWIAYVAEVGARWSAGDIVLASGGSADPAIYTDNPGDAESFQVPGNLTTLRGRSTGDGSMDLEFRIGLKSTYTPTADFPARYAMIVILHSNYSYVCKIFLRQGHGADYLFEKTDPLPTTEERYYRQRLSPYNLTMSSMHSGVQSLECPFRGGVFTQYPSQAGSLFVHSDPRQSLVKIACYNPVNPGNNAVPSSWPPLSSNDFKGYYHDSCPAGYRRPTGAKTGELVTSLIEDHNGFCYGRINRNTLSGYYADGFFDRRPTTSGVNNTTPNCAVSPFNTDVAYAGRIYYNRYGGSIRRLSSIFLPYAGYRSENGYITGAGNSSSYRTSTAVYALTEYDCLFYEHHQYRLTAAEASSIRCVAN